MKILINNTTMLFCTSKPVKYYVVPNYAVNQMSPELAGTVANLGSQYSLLVCEIPNNAVRKVSIDVSKVLSGTYNTFLYSMNPILCDSQSKLSSMLLWKGYSTKTGDNGKVQILDGTKYIVWNIEPQESHDNIAITFELADGTTKVVNVFGGEIMPD